MFFVMAGLVPAIHVLAAAEEDVDARHPSPPRLRRATNSLGRRSFSEGGKAGHDEALGWALRERNELEGVALALDMAGVEMAADHQDRLVGEAREQLPPGGR